MSCVKGDWPSRDCGGRRVARGKGRREGWAVRWRKKTERAGLRRGF